MHAKVVFPRFFGQFGGMDGVCQDISQSRSLMTTIHSG
jgi:hypothetical protein